MIDAMDMGLALVPAALAVLALVTLPTLVRKPKTIRVRARRTYPAGRSPG